MDEWGVVDLVGWEVKTWGQVGASLLSVATVLSALTALWQATRDYQGDIVQVEPRNLLAGTKPLGMPQSATSCVNDLMKLHEIHPRPSLRSSTEDIGITLTPFDLIDRIGKARVNLL